VKARKKRRQLPQLVERSPYARQQAEAQQVARGEGLYLMVEGSVQRPRWSFFCARSGRELIRYFPTTRNWTGTWGLSQGKCCGWRAALDLAVERRQRQEGGA
jgi:hypothetical protein